MNDDNLLLKFILTCELAWKQTYKQNVHHKEVITLKKKMEGKKVCQRYLSKNLGPVHTYPDIFEKKKEKKDELWSKMAKSKRHKATFN